MTTTKWTINTSEEQDLRYPAARFDEKRFLPVGVWRCSKTLLFSTPPAGDNLPAH